VVEAVATVVTVVLEVEAEEPLEIVQSVATVATEHFSFTGKHRQVTINREEYDYEDCGIHNRA